MKPTRFYQHRHVLVIGLAKSGAAAARLLAELGAKVVVNDQKPLSENMEAKQLEPLGIRVVCGGHPLELLDEPFDLVVKNPGIPYTNPMVKKALEKGLPVVTEVELAYHISEGPFIGITGSNGKTTTTTLIYEMLKADGQDPLLAGNIGLVACEVAREAKRGNGWSRNCLRSSLPALTSFAQPLGFCSIFSTPTWTTTERKRRMQRQRRTFSAIKRSAIMPSSMPTIRS
ncbi:UDP-N-acetylmuramoylalanine--D-glutamate ligase [Geobacillus sp. BCO2]|nr:UDP-N-acetylmuramoylalanine--D-glutamate ligase [Geobacillus sp. BCO2]